MSSVSLNDKMLSSLKSLVANKETSVSLQSELDLQMTDWMTLLVAQLQNQDMDNQVDTTEMISQLAQYSQIQAIQELVSIGEDMYATSITSYAASLIGKEVTVAEIKTTTSTSGTTDELVTTKGKVTGVTLFEGEPYVYIGDQQFSLSQIMIVGDVEGDTAVEDTTTDTETDSTDSVEGSEETDTDGTGDSTVDTETSTDTENSTDTETESGTDTEADTE